MTTVPHEVTSPPSDHIGISPSYQPRNMIHLKAFQKRTSCKATLRSVEKCRISKSFRWTFLRHMAWETHTGSWPVKAPSKSLKSKRIDLCHKIFVVIQLFDSLLNKWWVRVKNFWPKSDHFFMLGSGWVIHLWIWKIYPQNARFFYFSHFGSKKSHRIWSKNN